MTAPLHGMGSILARAIGKMRPGVVVGVFVDGSRAANHFRCFRCDHNGDDVSGVSDLLSLHDGYVYLLTDEAGEFVIRERDARVLKQAGPRVPASVEGEHLDATREPTQTQVRYLRAILELDLQTSDNVGLPELRAALKVRSLYAVQDQVQRLEAKGLVRRRVVGENGRRRELISLTEASEQWLKK